MGRSHGGPHHFARGRLELEEVAANAAPDSTLGPARCGSGSPEEMERHILTKASRLKTDRSYNNRSIRVANGELWRFAGGSSVRGALSNTVGW
jgi:hypothetical protein